MSNGIEPAAYKFTCSDEDCGGIHLSTKSDYPQAIKCAGREHAGSRAFQGTREVLYAASDVPQKWRCNACETEFYVDTSEGEGTACPRCAAVQTTKISLNSGDNTE